MSFAIGATAIGAHAQTSAIKAKTPDSAYLQDNNQTVVRSAYGLCWRTGNWLAADAILGCDGELTPPIANPTAPAVAAPFAQVVTPAVTPEPKRCDFTATLENDQTFPFNSAILTKAAKKRVDDEVLPRLANCTNIESIRITGHTDLLGSQKYNQLLSENRAGNLAAYLKSKNIVFSINTLGVGATQPVKTCSKNLPRKKLIQCLAPNRRLIIEVEGRSVK
ncbi:MAG: OmpA family protein [Glaciimonas sp.]|nr:OmpA family protein [Glaciimonas sp.]